MILLRAGNWECAVEPRWGMNPAMLQYAGEAVLRPPETEEALAQRPCVYGSALLLPANRTAGGQFAFDGREYALPLNDPAGNNHVHGFVNCSEFAVDSADEQTVCAHLENRGEIYPFPFRLEVCYRLTEDGFFQTFRVVNTGEGRMPFTFGLHTNFAEPAILQVPIGQRWEKDTSHIPTGVLLPLDDREQAYRDGFRPDKKPVTGLFTSVGHRAVIGDYDYEVSENFDQWVLWNGNGQQMFVSVEPQSGAVNGLNSGVGLQVLEPGGQAVFQTHIGRR